MTPYKSSFYYYYYCLCACLCCCIYLCRSSWLILYVIMVTALTLVITLICWMSSLFINCNVVILFLLFFLYGLTMISLAFLTTPFFRKAELAGNVVSVAVMACGFIFMAVAYTRDFSHRDGPVSAVPPWSQWLLSLLSPVAFTLAIDQVHAYLPLVVFHIICLLELSND